MCERGREKSVRASPYLRLRGERARERGLVVSFGEEKKGRLGKEGSSAAIERKKKPFEPVRVFFLPRQSRRHRSFAS